MLETQKAVVIQKFESDEDAMHETVKIEEIPVPRIEDGEVLLRILMRPINPIDHITLHGYHPTFPKDQCPLVPGAEAVAELVTDGKLFKKGQLVMQKHWAGISNANGTYQEYIAASETRLVAVPQGKREKNLYQNFKELSPSQLKAIAKMTAVGMLRVLDIPKGEWLIQTAAGSSLGRIIIKVAKHKGIKTINVVRRSAQKQELYDLGADVVIATDKEDIEPKVQEVTGGKGVHGGMDAVVGEMTGKLVSATRPSGKILIYGLLSGLTLTASAKDILFGQRHILGYTTPTWFYSNDPKTQDESIKEVFDMLKNNVINTEVRGTYPLAEVQRAIIESLKSGNGKVYLSS